MKKVSFFRSIHLKFVMIYIFLILIAMQIIGVYFVNQLENQLEENFYESLNERVSLLIYNLEQELKDESIEKKEAREQNIRQLLHDFSNEDTNVIVVDQNARIIGISEASSQGLIGKKTMDTTLLNVLITKTPTPKEGIDPDTRHRVQIIAAPIISNNDTLGAVYVTSSMEVIYDQMRQINRILLTGTGLALLVTGVLGILLAQTITRPISEMRKLAGEMAQGNFSKKVKVYGYDEIGQLSLAFNNLSKKLQEARSTTEGERRKLSSIIKYMTDGVIATDRKGRVILINSPACSMLDVSRETSMNESILSLLNLEDKYNLQQIFEELDSVLLDYSTEGEPFLVRASFSPILKENGRVNGLIVVLYDVTEQEKIEQERREFVANVSHELRTPLTTMKSYLEALADGAWQDEEIAPRFLDVTQNETERMIRLVNDLLSLSKLDSTDYHLNKEWINFPYLFNHIIDRFEMTKENNVQFHRAFHPREVYVQIDKDKITQVLDNIISNALKYSPEGGKITYQLRIRPKTIKISITDQGVGIPKENINRIFDRFYRVDRARSRNLGGTGLGLAIAKEMVRAHGGNIWAESVEGKGTTIHFTLPNPQDHGDF